MLLPKDYVRFCLTGEYATDVSDASGTSLFDVVHRRWSFEMIGAFGVGSIRPAGSCTNRLRSRAGSRAAAAETTGLAEGTPVVAGAGDQAASAVGNGIVEARNRVVHDGNFGRGVRSHGEVGLRPAWPRPHILSCGRGNWHVMGVTQGAGLSLQWFRNNFAPDAGLRRAHGRSRHRAGRLRRSVLAALPDGRAYAAPRCGRPRRLDRTHRQTHARRSDPLADRRRFLQPEGLPRPSSRRWARP